MELIWPERLPKPFYDGYGYAPVSPFIRTQMDSGRARHRRRFRSVATKINVTWKIRREDMKDFRFFIFDLVGGAGWGFFKTPLLFDGDQCKLMKARFTNSDVPFNASNEQNKHFIVTAELEVFELDLISSGDYYTRNPDQFGFLIGNRLHVHVNQTMPSWNL